MFYRLTWAGLVLLSTACATSGSAPGSPPRSPDRTSVSEPSEIISTPALSLLPDGRARSYLSRATTILEFHSDTSSAQDSVTVLTDFTVSATSEGGSLKLAGTIDHISIKAGSRIGQLETPLAVPFAFTGSVENSTLFLDSLNNGATTGFPCLNNAFGTLALLRRNVVILPSVIRSGMTWTDSADVSACSGPIPVNLTLVQTYRIIGETGYEGQQVLLVERIDQTRVAGEGSQGQHRILISSEGTGSAKLYVSRTTGSLVVNESEQKADINVTSSGRVQKFTQTVRERTTVKPSA